MKVSGGFIKQGQAIDGYQPKALLRRHFILLQVICVILCLVGVVHAQRGRVNYPMDDSEASFRAAVANQHYEMAAMILGNRAADDWSANRFPQAMQDFKRFGIYADPFNTMNPYESKEEIIRESLLMKDFQRRFVRFMYNTYALPQYKALCEQNDCLTLAWEMTEKLKSRLLRAELLSGALLRLDEPTRRRAKELMQRLKQRKLERNYARVIAGNLTGRPQPDPEVASIEGELAALLPEYVDLATKIAQPAEIRSVLRPEETLLSFFFTDNDRSIYVWKLEPNATPELHKLGINTIDLYVTIENLKAALQAGQKLETLGRPLGIIYRAVVEPLHLSSGKRLIIAADQNVSSLPFDIVPWSDGRLMMDSFEITYVPSASVFYHLRKNNLRAQRLYATGYAGFSYENEGDDRLSYANAEIANASKEMDQPVTGFNATEDDIYRHQEELANARYIHFVTHNYALSGSDGSFYLAFGRGRREDGRLTSQEILTRLKNHAELVILSACETATANGNYTLGVQVPLDPKTNPNPSYMVNGCICSYGESFSNLSGSFFAAGSKRLLLTQWRIADKPETTQFIDLLFGMLGQRKKPAEAVRLAKDAMRQKPPMYWAGFILAGD